MHDCLAKCDDGFEGDEIILIDIRRVAVKTHTILAVITLYLYAGNGSNEARHFGDLQNATVKLYSQGQDGSQLLRTYELTEGVSVCTAIAMASLTRDGDGWSFQAIAQGIGEGKSANGLEDVLRKYSR